MLLRRNVPLKELVSFEIGGPADYLCEAANIEDIKEALQISRTEKVPFLILGGGTNLLPKDDGFRGVVLKSAFNFINGDTTDLNIGAGVMMKELLDFAVSEGLSELEWAGGLPGTLGGAIRGNAGAFGGEIKDTILEVVSFDTETGRVIRRRNSECAFSYRNSIFKSSGGREIILGATLRFKKGNRETILASIQEKIAYRAARHPLDYPNAGSVFKNVDVKKAPAAAVEFAKAKIKNDPFPVIPAAYLIAEAGLKGVSVGGAAISPKHSNFIINSSGATSENVRELIGVIRRGVALKFGVDLEEEILIL